MRLWSIHPKYLDSKGLVALWREGLLAQKVLRGETRGYRNHPQLVRFKQTSNPIGAIACYLRSVVDEAERRGYHFDRSKIAHNHYRSTLPVNSGQLRYEFEHLRRKLEQRNPALLDALNRVKRISTHPIFRSIKGGVADWEVVS